MNITASCARNIGIARQIIQYCPELVPRRKRRQDSQFHAAVTGLNSHCLALETDRQNRMC